MFKDRLKELRQKEGLSQYELADKIFVSRSVIAKWFDYIGGTAKFQMKPFLPRLL